MLHTVHINEDSSLVGLWFSKKSCGAYETVARIRNLQNQYAQEFLTCISDGVELCSYSLKKPYHYLMKNR